MKIWNTVFVVLIIFLAFFTWIYGSKALAIRREWDTSIQKLQKQIDTNKTKLQSVLDGSDPNKAHDLFREFSEMRLGELRNRLDVMVADRGNAWFGCKPRELSVDNVLVTARQLGEGNPSTPEDKLQPIHLVEVSVIISSPVDWDDNEVVIPPDKLGGVFYVFDDGKDGKGGGVFLGRFTINGAPSKVDKNYVVMLKSATEFSENEVNLIKHGMQSQWAIYSSIPRDRYYDVFDRIKNDDLELIVPLELRANLTNKDRGLVDFDVVLTAEYLRYVKLNNKKKLLNKNIAELKTTISQMDNEKNDVNFAIQTEQNRIKLMEDQITAVTRVLEGYNIIIERIGNSIVKTQKQNDWYANKIAEYHLMSLQIIEKNAETAVKKLE
ncbi:MAG: hypothetical protein LBC74_01105 [Planctomycetaceae bacterium]|jgi:cell division protein FtsL|nr:hypothetical protein [Planctomycetaceae bacterium]